MRTPPPPPTHTHGGTDWGGGGTTATPSPSREIAAKAAGRCSPPHGSVKWGEGDHNHPLPIASERSLPLPPMGGGRWWCRASARDRPRRGMEWWGVTG